VRKFVVSHPGSLEEVYFVLFDDAGMEIYQKILGGNVSDY
jgi:hypothetical protein